MTKVRLAWLVVASLVVGAWIGHLVTPGPVLCEEDEVVLSDGRCWPLDDADYIGGVGWVTTDAALWRIDTEGDAP